MIGTKWPSEKHTFLDPVSGQPVTQLTDQYLNFHLYFTDNSFDPSCENIYFQSNRCNPESERCQLFRMNLESGEMEQLTDDPAGIMQAQVTKTKDGKLIAYFTGKELRLYNTETRENTLLYEEKGGCSFSEIDFTGVRTAGLVVGSEGGFDSAEIEAAASEKVKRVWLGNRILRCETAPITALSILMFLTNNM